MKSQVLDVQTLKTFNDEKRHQETIWSDDHARVSLICMKPGQEIVTHTHHGSHIWMVMEGTGQFQSGGKTQSITTGQIVIVPAFEDHGIRNASQENLVIASITAQGD
ncbi:cupin domain-containing protein [Geobacter sulfurreducens]|jgi:mannose-6-phosphate isomerase-like protein (cupin superfamily)|uniref:Cupin superfamily barrel domain protein n=3 Tax=Geobacter TaxID=28231 RepID=Q748U5_GEOSL|nr:MULTISPECIES: cupin domain-containing protein [Geobacter]BET59292.1 cupin domain-containing protein [Geobacter sp. 60473]AAR36298.1 cupin superfamily barrel domain protein [Geobacter sulfurreducens PCA]ADI85660.1 cupin superfamily barrel domain protein [Geobacter sulfurreducens KN400]AJY69169.1 cupin [Geobacter sulfurreducens]ANA41136.1 cupin [Geobacter anodireducens]